MMRERAKFWRLIHSLGISFWWIDADVVLAKDIEEMLYRPDAVISDAIFQMDTAFKISQMEMIDKWNFIPLADKMWAEACAGFFFAKATPANGDLFMRTEILMTEESDIEDQQGINCILRDESFSRIAFDPAPINLKLIPRSGEIRRAPHVHTHFPQLDIWSGHTRFKDVPFEMWEDEEIVNQTPFAIHLNAVKPKDKITRFKEVGYWFLEEGSLKCRKKGSL